MSVSRVEGGGASLNVQGLGNKAASRMADAFGARQLSGRPGSVQAEAITARMRELGDIGRGIQDGISMTQVASEGISAARDALVRLRDMAVRAESEDTTDEERAGVESQAAAVRSEIDAAGANAQYRGTAVLSGALAGDGRAVRTSGGEDITLAIDAVSQEALGLTGVSFATRDDAARARSVIDTALGTLNQAEMSLTGTQQRLTQAASLTNEALNAIDGGGVQSLGGAGGRDFAENLVSPQLRSQAGTAMVAQANMDPQSALRLLM